MKKIGIDARLYFQTGVGTYIRNLLHYLPNYLSSKYEICIYVLNKDVHKLNSISNIFTIYGVDANWHSFNEQTKFYKQIMSDNLDLMHFTYFSYPVLYKRPFVATVHDMTPILYKTGRASTLNPILYEIKYFIFRHILRTQIKLAKAIITPSETVKDQLVSFYGKAYQNKIYSFYEGVSFELLEKGQFSKISNEYDFSYFLYVGNFYPHKNVERLITAFFQIDFVDTPFKRTPNLLLVGPDNMFAKRLKSMITHKQRPYIKFIHDFKISSLKSLYKNALALVNPSLSEGFGLPLIEATYFNCPVIASDIPVFREILGNNYIPFNPTSIEDIKLKLQNFIPKQAAAPVNIDKFNFDKMTKNMFTLYASML